MNRIARRGGQRGVALVEVMVAGAVLLIAMLGFVATSRYAATATATGHRRTMTTFLRAELIDRMTVLPRSALAPLATLTGTNAKLQYVVDGCYDLEGRLVKRNVGFASSAADFCDSGTMYRSHVGARRSVAGDATWTVGVYVERVDQGCTPDTRFQSVGCSAADLLLTD